MLNPKQKIRVTHILDSALGVGQSLKSDERAHYCPFCHHAKRKMQVNLESQKFHCWVCNAKGRIPYLLKLVGVERPVIQEVNKIYDNQRTYTPTTEEKDIKLRLPVEFKPLHDIPKGLNPLYRNVMSYLKKRGITDGDIIKHNIGYCETGLYANRVIIPSYNKNNELNYFIARTIFDDNPFAYKNPPVSKNIIALESQINWNEPIVLCEGIFDALSIKRNVIPLFGKFISRELKKAIFTNQVGSITIILDEDAQKQALKYTDFFTKQGIRVKNIKPTGKDPSKMGFISVNTLIKQQTETSYSDLITQKLNNI